MYKLTEEILNNYITIETFMEVCDEIYHVAENTPSYKLREINNGYLMNNDCVIHCCTWNILEFFEYIRHFKKEYILVANHGDLEIDESVMSKCPSNIKKIYAQNANFIHNKLEPIPIAIASKKFDCGDLDLFRKKANQDRVISNLVYANFNIATNKIERAKLLNIIKNKHFITNMVGRKLNMEAYINQLYLHKFALSPNGNGIDCHRTWEALYLGVIPIVKRSILIEHFSKSLPFVVVDDWEEINEDFLNIKYEEIKNNIGNYNFEILNKKYWNNLLSK